MRPDAVTPLVLTYNEAPNIGRVLARLAWAPRVVVVDSYSTDDTCAIARRHRNVEVVQRRFDTHVDQWNYGLDQVHTPWVLTLDADYVFPDAFASELAALPDDAPVAGYHAHFRYCLAGRRLRGSLYPPRVVLFRREAGRYVSDGHTQRLAIAGPLGHLASVVDHDDRKPLADWLRAQERYATLEVTKLTSAPPASLPFRDRLRRRRWAAPAATLVYCLVVKRLALDGWPGWYYSFQRTYAELLLSLKLFERDLLPAPGAEPGAAPLPGPGRLAPLRSTAPVPRATPTPTRLES